MGIFSWAKKDGPVNAGPNYSETQGSTGTEIYGGFLDVEYLGKLVETRRRFDIYHQMRTSSATLQMCIRAVTASVLAAKWRPRVREEFEGNSDAENHLDFFEKSFDSDRLRALVKDMMTAVIYGFYLGERYYTPFYLNGKSLWAPRVRFLSQRTIDQWIIGPKSGKWEGVIQRAYGDTAVKNNLTLSSNNLVHFAVDQEGDNFEGISMLRACYGNYVRKSANFKNIAIGNKILSIPFVVVTQTENTGILEEEDLEKLNKFLSRRVDGEKYRGDIILPPGFDAKDIPSSFDPVKLYESNDRENHEMARNFLCSFLLLAGGARGSFALSKDLSGFFMQSLEVLAGGIEAAINKYLIAPTFELNFGDTQTVEITHSEVGGQAGKDLAMAIATLAQVGIVMPDDSLEAWTRKKYGMPEADETGIPRPGPGGFLPKDNDEGENKKNDDVDEDEDGKQLSIELANRRDQQRQAQRGIRRIKRLQKDLKEVIILEMSEIIKAKKNKILKFAKEGKVPSIEDLGTSTSRAIKNISHVVISAANDQMNDLKKTIELSYKLSQTRLRSTIKHLCNAEVNAMVAELDNATLYSMLQAMGSLGNPEQITAVVLDAALVTIESKLSNSKTTVLPAKTINMANEVVYQEIGVSEIESYTYYNSSPVAAICKYMAGKTLKTLDAERYQPPFHFNCTTMRLANLKSFQGNPKSTRPAPNAKAVKSIQLEGDCCE